MLKYGKTPQYEDVVYNVKANTEFDSDSSGPIYPKIRFQGTVKVHGTNAAVVIYKDRVAFQSRT